MFKKAIAFSVLILISSLSVAQKSKINAAWRGLTDYQSTLKEKPDPSYLFKAKEAIDAAAANEESKTNPKTHIYKTQIYYELFKNSLKSEEEKAAATSGDKKQRMEMAYSNVSTKDFTEALTSIAYVKNNVKDKTAFQELLTTGLSMIDDLNNLAVGAYKGKKYDEASDYFESSFNLSGMVNQGRKDTVSLFNASLSAQKAKNYSKVVKLNQRMIDEKMANAGTYQYLYNAKINSQDTVGALATMQEGRKLFPNDVTLLNLETEYFIKTGKQAETIANLVLALEKDPNNAVMHLITANTYDGMANPKTKGPDGKDKDLDKPANFAELFAKAEEHYKKTVELKPSNTEYSFNALYNLGALYYNYGTYIYNKEMTDASITKLAAKQREIMAKCNENYKKAIPNFEQALDFKPDDSSTLQSLRRLYLLVGNEAKAAEITTRLNKGK